MKHMIMLAEVARVRRRNSPPTTIVHHIVVISSFWFAIQLLFTVFSWLPINAIVSSLALSMSMSTLTIPNCLLHQDNERSRVQFHDQKRAVSTGRGRYHSIIVHWRGLLCENLAGSLNWKDLIAWELGDCARQERMARRGVRAYCEDRAQLDGLWSSCTIPAAVFEFRVCVVTLLGWRALSDCHQYFYIEQRNATSWGCYTYVCYLAK